MKKRMDSMRRKTEDPKDGEVTKHPAHDCGCADGQCGGTRISVGRRDFLKMSGAGLLATSLGRPLSIMAGAFSAADLKDGHLVPMDKQLAEEWIRQLFARGEKEVFRGKSLKLIGMPCGGIGSGQLYLAGDGSLGCWQIFNHARSNWVGDTGSTYAHPHFDQPVNQGFFVVTHDAPEPQRRRLNSEGFSEVEFCGTYPIGTVRYSDPASQVRVEMEAFSPFVPLKAHDSNYPATLFHVTVANTTDRAVTVSTEGMLENAAGMQACQKEALLRTSRISAEGEDGLLYHTLKKDTAALEDSEPIVFASFDGDTFGDWTVEGNAFGKGPVDGPVNGQAFVRGFLGARLVNSYARKDAGTGTLTSPEFIIERPFINFLAGGWALPETVGIHLEADGQRLRSVTGNGELFLEWQSWYVGDLLGRKARLVIEDRSGTAHILADHFEFSHHSRTGLPSHALSLPDFGSMALACAGCEPEANEEMTYPVTERRDHVLASRPITLAPGDSHTFTFVLAWYFPNHKEGHVYATRFNNAADVARDLLANRERLSAETRAWRDAYYDSSLPYWLLDRLHAPISYLSTGTCEWWGNGRFWAWEGVNCCGGTCTHVWNYAHGHARLFPELGRNVREMQDLSPRESGGGFHEDTGLVGFRSDDNYAADGQCGTVLKAYREHLMSPDDSFLRRYWPRIKKALEYSIHHDNNFDGLLEDKQHNTYDIDYYGPNTFVGALYLAALRAGEEMAREVGDDVFAAHVRAIYASGARLSLERLWNGEYFEQDVSLEEHPNHQYGTGCLSDQLFGQGWAHQVQLGYLYPEENVKTALQAVWKYNWAPDIAPYNASVAPQRWFITPGQAGLFTCTWPKGERPNRPTLYDSEVWTGIEYQVAGHMAYEGMLTEALAICRAVHDRYHPDLLNPYNEVECGDHYARAMASWGVYLALGGFHYHGPKGILGFAPRITPEDFKAAYTTAEGWVSYRQTRQGEDQTSSISMLTGSLKLHRLELETPPENASPRVNVELNGRRVRAVDVNVASATVTITLDEALRLEKGDELTVRLT
jgi:uncharacterized protein (DUF608 family)